MGRRLGGWLACPIPGQIVRPGAGCRARVALRRHGPPAAHADEIVHQPGGTCSSHTTETRFGVTDIRLPDPAQGSDRVGTRQVHVHELRDPRLVAHPRPIAMSRGRSAPGDFGCETAGKTGCASRCRALRLLHLPCLRQGSRSGGRRRHRPAALARTSALSSWSARDDCAECRGSLLDRVAEVDGERAPAGAASARPAAERGRAELPRVSLGLRVASMRARRTGGRPPHPGRSAPGSASWQRVKSVGDPAACSRGGDLGRGPQTGRRPRLGASAPAACIARRSASATRNGHAFIGHHKAGIRVACHCARDRRSWRR